MSACTGSPLTSNLVATNAFATFQWRLPKPVDQIEAKLVKPGNSHGQNAREHVLISDDRRNLVAVLKWGEAPEFENLRRSAVM